MVIGDIINTTGIETGVTVNGIVATVYGNQFVANHLPLAEGLNTITAIATDSEGKAASTSITVNAVTAGEYIRLTANIESGISPLEAVLSVDGTFSIESSDISSSGPTQPELLESTADEYRVRMTTEGIYYITASSTGTDNILYQDTIAIIVLNQAQMDTLIRGKWEGMKGALMNNDIEGALDYFSNASKDEYREIFELLNSELRTIAAAMREITMSEVMGNTIEYYIKRFQRGVDISYFIYFVRDEKGMWRINGF